LISHGVFIFSMGDDDSVFAQLAALEEEERGILKQTKDAGMIVSQSAYES
jgi:hypothetical protein